MKLPFRGWALAALFGLLLVPRLGAQELTFLGGLLPNSDTERSSYTWQVDYRQDFTRYFAASLAYINEGHLRAHHRDGTAWEAWGRLPMFHERFSVELGVGAYYYFDTQPLPGGDSADVHGTAPIYSLSGTAYLSNRWFLRALLNRVSPAHDIQISTATIGAGFWFGRDKKPTAGKLGDAPDEYSYVTENELTIFGGQSVVNTFFSQEARAYALEYRRGVLPHIDWTASAIYEGDPQIIRRSGLATQVWAVNTFFHDRVAVGAGLGPYVYLDHKHPVDPNQKIPASVAPLASLTFAALLSDRWTVRLVFDRVVSNYNRDADIFLVGFGCRWPK